MPSLPGSEHQQSSQAWTLVETAQSTTIGLTVAMLGIAPLTAPILIVILALLTAIVEWRGGGAPLATLSSALRTQAGLAGLAFIGFAGLSATWSSEPSFGFSSVLRVAVTLCAAIYLTIALRRQIHNMNAEQKNRIIRAIPIGAVIALVFLFIETSTRNGLSNFALQLLPKFWSGSSKLGVSGDGSISRLLFEPFMLNRGIAAMVIIAPALMLAISLWTNNIAKHWVIATLTTWLAVIVSMSESETAKLALVGGVVFYALAARRPAGSWRALSTVCAIGTSLALPLGALPYGLGVHTWSSASFSARERVLIWRNTAVSSLAQPLFGVGVQSTRFQNSDLPMIVSPSGKNRSPLGWHTHNAFLQTWFELGAVGACALLMVLLGLIGSWRRLDPRVHPTAVALMAISILVASTGWSMWQPWLVATLGIGMAFVGMLEAVVAPRFAEASVFVRDHASPG